MKRTIRRREFKGGNGEGNPQQGILRGQIERITRNKKYQVWR